MIIRLTNLFILSLYTLLVVCMGIATIFERQCGSEWVHDNIYATWWFSALWAALVLVSLVCLYRYRVYKKLAVAMLHLSFVIILIGAFVTHLTAEEGTLHLRKGVPTTCFTDNEGAVHTFPFSISLREFSIVHYPGTDAVMDYHAGVTVCDASGEHNILVSMNNIGRVEGYRFYQSSYDADEQGTVLLVAYDPYGIAVTYTGYLMLLLGLVWTMFSRRTRIRCLMQSAMRPAVVAVILLAGGSRINASEVNKDIADEMGHIAVLYNGRICPLNTVATEFVTKLCGRGSWNGQTANEIFIGWTIFYSEWEEKRIIRVDDKGVQGLLGIDDRWACVRDFYTPQHEYKLSGKANDLSLSEKTRTAVRTVDEKIQVITMFYNSEMLRIFPLPSGGKVEWHVPGSTELPRDVGEAEFQFVNHVMDYLVKSILANDVAEAKSLIAKIRLFQREKAGEALPPAFLMRAETLYNVLQSSLRAAPYCLALCLVLCLMYFAMRPRAWIRYSHAALILLMTVLLTVLICLRWLASRHIPLSNGFETMLFMAWITMLLTVLLSRRMPVITPLGPVVSSFCMLVAMLAGGTPQITPLMPVLQSPLLAVHVTLVMMSYALIALLTLVSLCCLLVRQQEQERARLTALSQFLLYPAVSLLAVGIFVGAVWANFSWGAYWSWDPKETWALITLMIYALPLHRASFSPCVTTQASGAACDRDIMCGETPGMTDVNGARRYHLYILIAFLSVLMTYFGVNYFLSGMHSYA